MTTQNQSVLPAVPAEAGEVRAPELRCGDGYGSLCASKVENCPTCGGSGYRGGTVYFRRFTKCPACDGAGWRYVLVSEKPNSNPSHDQNGE